MIKLVRIILFIDWFLICLIVPIAVCFSPFIITVISNNTYYPTWLFLITVPAFMLLSNKMWNGDFIINNYRKLMKDFNSLME
jgi:hypothetical protein